MVVDKELLSDHTKKVIHDNLVWQHIYMNYRRDVWDDPAQDRQCESFDAFYYDPAISNLVNQARKDASSPLNRGQAEDSL